MDNSVVRSLELKIDSVNYLRIFSIINKYGGSARLVGGVVRDALLGKKSKDIDIATDLLPDKIEEIFSKEGLKVVPTGKNFGTISVFMYLPTTDSFESFEITTLRKDLSCDGRKAYVEYCNDYFEDAKRRDFTINAISYDPIQQKLYDYFNGIEDLNNKRIKFIGEAAQRIKEDYLRILRYFRFMSRFAIIHKHSPSNIGVTPNNKISIKLEDKIFIGIVEVDSESLSACRTHAEGINRLSRERIKSEMDVILGTKNAPYILQIMIDQGIWQHIFHYTDNSFKPADILTLQAISEKFNKTHARFEIESSSYYAVIFSSVTCKQLIDLKFSSKEAKLIENLVQNRNKFLAEYKKDTNTAQRYLQNYLTRKWLDDINYPQFFIFACFYLNECKNVLIDDAFKIISSTYEKLQTYLDTDERRPEFPLKSGQLIEIGFVGPALGAILSTLKDMWIDSNFTIPKESLLEEARKNL